MAYGRYWSTMTKEQAKACYHMWSRSQWHIEGYRTFRRRFRRFAMGDEQGYYGVNLWGMFIGIEPDVYTHS